MLAGCAFRPDSLDLGIAFAPKYLAAAGPPYAAPPALDWWGGFRSAELTRLVREAQELNVDIAAAIARVEQADASARIAGAPLLPNVSLAGSATRSRSAQSQAAAEAAVGGRERTSFSASLAASYEIDFWGKNRAAALAAGESAVAARYAQEVVVVTTLAATANAYFQVLTAQERLSVARRNIAAATRVLNLIRERLDVGTASALETAQQESLVAGLRAAIPLLEQTLAQSRFALAVLIGRPPEWAQVRGGGLFDVAIPRISPGLPADLIVQRPDIRQAEALLAAAQANVQSARAQMLPSISLTAQGGYVSAALRNLVTPESAFFSLAANLAQPVFDGFRLQGNLELQRARQTELLQAYRKSILSGFSDVENALVAVRQSAQRERLQRDVVASSRRAFGIAESRLREGTVDQVTVLNTQQTLFQAEDALALARLARLQAVVSLYQALGGGWTPAPFPPSGGRLAGRP